MQLRALALFLALLTAVDASAARYRFRHFGPDDGLGSTVTRLLQDRTGFLWVGTASGLFRYDGARFQRFGAEEGLPGANIRSLKEGPDGSLWALTERGLARFYRDSFRAVETGIAGQELRALDIDTGGQMYVGLDRGLLVGVAPRGGTPEFTLAPGAPADRVDAILAESNGNVWFSCGLQLCLLTQGRVRVFDQTYGLPPERWGVIFRDRAGDLWLRGPRHLYVLPHGDARFLARDADLPPSVSAPLGLTEDRRGHLLVSTDRGLARRIDGHWELTGAAQGLQSETVTSILEDREGSVWLGLWGSGLAQWQSPDEWTNWTAADGIGSDTVRAIRRDSSGTAWLGTGHGLVRLQARKPPQTLTVRNGLGGDNVTGLEIGPDGTIWAACSPGGVSRIDSKSVRIRNYAKAAGLLDDRTIALHIDLESRLWASTGGGLFRSNSLEPKLRFDRELPPGTTPQTVFSRFLTDREGRLWVASNRGLFRLDSSGWAGYTTANGLKSDSVTHIAEADDGAIWVGYREPLGVSRLVFGPVGVEVSHFIKSGGLPSDSVLFLGLDASRRLWAGTDNGVAVRTAGVWTAYNHEDGMAWDDCADGSFFAEPDGAVWVGTSRGLSRYRPGGRSANILAPPVAVTGVHFGERSADPAVHSEVPFRHRDFQVTFAALSYLREKSIGFRYRLQGLDDRWIETAQREARYPGLPPGSYRFQVAARRGNGPWSPVPAAVSFLIVPLWWATWWFQCGVAGTLMLLIGLLARFRWTRTLDERRRLEGIVREGAGELQFQKTVAERQNRENRELLCQAREASQWKGEFAANLIHEIRTPIGSLIRLTQLVLQTRLDAEQHDYISAVRDAAESLLAAVNNVLNSPGLEADKMELCREPFSVRLTVTGALAVFTWRAEEKSLALGCDIEAQVPRTVAGDAGRLHQVLIDLLDNAVKFTERGEVSLEVSLDQGPAVTLHFVVRDTGIGIAPEAHQRIVQAFAHTGASPATEDDKGSGLANAAKLVDLMQGRIWLESGPSGGSAFHFTARFDAVPDPVPPVAPPPEQAEPVEQPPACPLGQ